MREGTKKQGEKETYCSTALSEWSNVAENVMQEREAAKWCCCVSASCWLISVVTDSQTHSGPVRSGPGSVQPPACMAASHRDLQQSCLAVLPHQVRSHVEPTLVVFTTCGSLKG